MNFSVRFLFLLLLASFVLTGHSMTISQANDHIILAEETSDARLQLTDFGDDTDDVDTGTGIRTISKGTVFYQHANRYVAPRYFIPRTEARAPPAV